jgi:hypothetical protein
VDVAEGIGEILAAPSGNKPGKVKVTLNASGNAGAAGGKSGGAATEHEAAAI